MKYYSELALSHSRFYSCVKSLANVLRGTHERNSCVIHVNKIFLRARNSVAMSEMRRIYGIIASLYVDVVFVINRSFHWHDASMFVWTEFRMYSGNTLQSKGMTHKVRFTIKNFFNIQQTKSVFMRNLTTIFFM